MTQPINTQIVSRGLRIILQGIREVSGSHFPKILEKASLSRYLKELPPDDLSFTINRSDLSRLYAATYQVAGETMLRQFLQIYGQRLPDAILASPLGQEMKARVARVPASERLAETIRVLADASPVLSSEMRVTEDSEYYYLETAQCLTCAEIRGAQHPICGNVEFVLGSVARALSGVRVMALETECFAAGAPKCKYRIRK